MDETTRSVIAKIRKSESGVNRKEPKSVGGISVDGVTRQSYKVWLNQRPDLIGRVPNDVEGLLDIEGKLSPQYDGFIDEFYVWYLEDKHVWEVPPFLQYMYSDFVVNAGAAATKIIQRMAGVPDDGIWGSGTSKAVAAWVGKVMAELESDPDVDNDLITQFHNEKLEHYDRLVTANPWKFEEWHKGWKRRANHVLSELQEYFEVEESTPSAMDDEHVLDVMPEPENVEVKEELPPHGTIGVEQPRDPKAEIEKAIWILERVREQL